MRRRTMRLALVAGLLAAIAPPAGGIALSAPCGASGKARAAGMEIVQLRTFHVEIEVPKKTYRIGQTAIFNLTVTRPAHEDPLGQGQPVDPPTSEPAPDVGIGVGLIVKDVYLYGLGITDQAGQAQIRVKLPKYTPPGHYAQARAFAKKNVVDSPCLTVDEIGFRALPDAFKVADR